MGSALMHILSPVLWGCHTGAISHFQGLFRTLTKLRNVSASHAPKTVKNARKKLTALFLHKTKCNFCDAYTLINDWIVLTSRETVQNWSPNGQCSLMPNCYCPRFWNQMCLSSSKRANSFSFSLSRQEMTKKPRDTKSKFAADRTWEKEVYSTIFCPCFNGLVRSSLFCYQLRILWIVKCWTCTSLAATYLLPQFRNE